MKRDFDPANARREFWASSDEALHTRETIAAAIHASVDLMESFAIKGGGPTFQRLGRRALYRKADVLEWIERNSQRVDNTAQLKRTAA